MGPPKHVKCLFSLNFDSERLHYLIVRIENRPPGSERREKFHPFHPPGCATERRLVILPTAAVESSPINPLAYLPSAAFKTVGDRNKIKSLCHRQARTCLNIGQNRSKKHLQISPQIIPKFWRKIAFTEFWRKRVFEAFSPVNRFFPVWF